MGEWRKLGIDVAKATVETYRVRSRTPPSPTWKTFLNHHAKDVIAMDFFGVPTVTFKVLFVLLILAHTRRRVVHITVTEHPTAAWTAQQVVEAFPWNDAPRDLLRDQGHIYGASFHQRVRKLGDSIIMMSGRPHAWADSELGHLATGRVIEKCRDGEGLTGSLERRAR